MTARLFKLGIFHIAVKFSAVGSIFVGIKFAVESFAVLYAKRKFAVITARKFRNRAVGRNENFLPFFDSVHLARAPVVKIFVANVFDVAQVAFTCARHDGNFNLKPKIRRVESLNVDASAIDVPTRARVHPAQDVSFVFVEIFRVVGTCRARRQNQPT